MKGLFLCGLWLLVTGLSHAGTPPLQIAVAANFYPSMQALTKAFDPSDRYQIKLSMGSTGALYGQIVHGAPYDLFFAADSLRPQKLAKAGVIVRGSRHTYGMGQLALWMPSVVAPKQADLAGLRGKLAIANPRLAPYGHAAVASLSCFKLTHKLSEKLVLGNNVAQVFSFVQSGNAQAGMVAYSQLNAGQRQHSWLIPEQCYGVIRQQMVQLKRAANSALARQFSEFVMSAKGQQLIRSFGYLSQGDPHDGE